VPRRPGTAALHDQLALSAGHHADDFEAVAGVERGFGPLGAEEGGAVVFHQGGGEGEAQFGDEGFDVGRLHFAVLSVEHEFHEARMA